MSGVPPSSLTQPLLIGFDMAEDSLRRPVRGNDGYPPYNIERLRPGDAGDAGADYLRITLAVAGFSESEMEILTEQNRLVIRGRQAERPEAEYLYRGIAARQFQRIFLLGDGLEVSAARLGNGLLSIDLVRPQQVAMVRKINISVRE